MLQQRPSRPSSSSSSASPRAFRSADFATGTGTGARRGTPPPDPPVFSADEPLARTAADRLLVLKDRYVIHELVGRGAMSSVYRATDTTLHRSVAVKLLRPHLAREHAFVQQFLQTERRVAGLFHPNLVAIYDTGADENGCYVVMEYVAGGTLRDLLAEQGALPVAQVIRLIAQTADALEVLHADQIIHGDVKPDNVLLDEQGNAKLVDSGVAQLATSTGVLAADRLSGTTAYLAPEQVQSGRADARSDVYALALVAYELLAGRRGFEGDNWVAVARQRLERDPDPLTEVRPDTPTALESVLRRALARDPASRFASAAELNAALLRVPLTSLTAPLPPSPSSARVSRFSREGLGERSSPRRKNPLLSLGRGWGWGWGWGWGLLKDPASPSPSHAGTGVHPAHRGIQASRRARPARFPTAWTDLALRAQSTAARLARRDLALAAAAGLVVGLLAAGVVPRLQAQPRLAPVPTLAGETLDAALVTAQQAGFSLAETSQPSDAAPVGTVLSQNPASGTTARTDDRVSVVLSSGPGRVRVPNLTAQPLSEARATLASLGLQLGMATASTTTTAPSGTIVQQTSAAGSLLARGASVNVAVAVPPTRDVPAVTGDQLGDAQAALQAQGLQLGAVTQQATTNTNTGTRSGTVLSQSPAAHVALRQGEPVAVTIAVPPSPAPGGSGS